MKYKLNSKQLFDCERISFQEISSSRQTLILKTSCVWLAILFCQIKATITIGDVKEIIYVHTSLNSKSPPSVKTENTTIFQLLQICHPIVDRPNCKFHDRFECCGQFHGAIGTSARYLVRNRFFHTSFDFVS